jgi:hypothetical protein
MKPHTTNSRALSVASLEHYNLDTLWMKLGGDPHLDEQGHPHHGD